MRFLGDMGISRSTIAALRALGHDATHLYEQGLERMQDWDVLTKAREEGRVLLTADLDFGELLWVGIQQFPSVVIFRLRRHRPELVTRRLLLVLEEHQQELLHGAIITVEEGRHRIRHLPITP
ncbi:MAG: DUF5615 family PIN-like protein [Candidatus Hydrogenedentes bacterium]|nr:DUF5615 family PIN-like protein [Candidatus Hydrogenedentota bacterium]